MLRKLEITLLVPLIVIGHKSFGITAIRIPGCSQCIRGCTLSTVKFNRYVMTISTQIPGQKVNPQRRSWGAEDQYRAWNEMAGGQDGSRSALPQREGQMQSSSHKRASRICLLAPTSSERGKVFSFLPFWAEQKLQRVACS